MDFNKLTPEELDDLLGADNSKSPTQYDDPMAAKNVAQSAKQSAFYPTPDGKLPASAPIVLKPTPAMAKPSMKSPGAPFPANKPEPIPEPVLQKLEATQPDLVAKYRAKMAGVDQGVKDAQANQDMGSYGNIAGRLANDFANSQKDDTIYHNSFAKMGNAPQIEKADRPEYDGSAIDKLGAQGVQRAKEAKAGAENDFNQEEKLTDLSTSRADHQRTVDEAARLKDPKSAESKAARDRLKLVAPKTAAGMNLESLSANDINQIAPQVFQDSQRQLTQSFQAGQGALDRQNKTDIEAQKLSKANVKQMSGEEQKRYGLAADGLKAVRGMRAALDGGDNTFSLVGDNDYTFNRSQFEEAIGRMNSGGAINDEEAKRFKAMAPTASDSREMQRKKLNNIEQQMSARIKDLGKDPEEAVKERGGMSKNDQLSDSDKQAVEWARANASDPRAKGIVEKLRQEGKI